MAGITDSQGNRLIDFHYEGYGESYYTSYDTEKAALLAQINPFGYRGYVLDLGTYMYYLQSRYYDPALGRFINADNIISTDSVVFKNLYSYCENNPIMGYDPTGHWNWRGFWTGVGVAALGIGLAVLSVVTFGAAAPLAVGVGVAVGVALAGTGIVTSYAAAAEKTMVLDVSTTNGTTRDKTGYSVVIDFDTDTAGVETYYHYGKTSDGYGATYSFGLVSGYEELGDYGGPFVDAGATYSYKGFNYGVDICTDPTAPFKKCYAVSGTVGISFPNSSGGKMSGYVGVDYYLPISYIEWG